MVELRAKEAAVQDSFITSKNSIGESGHAIDYNFYDDGDYYTHTYRNADGQSLTDKMWLAQKKVVIELAKKCSCVIVGRCADYILKDIADCIKTLDNWGKYPSIAG